MRFLFDCEDEVCMPMAYNLVDDIKPFIDKVKEFEVSEEEAKKLQREIILSKPLETFGNQEMDDLKNKYDKL